jgi:hypothetical protein
MEKAKAVVPAAHLWVNPDCGLKTRQWEETKKALTEMVNAAKELRMLVLKKRFNNLNKQAIVKKGLPVYFDIK